MSMAVTHAKPAFILMALAATIAGLAFSNAGVALPNRTFALLKREA